MSFKSLFLTLGFCVLSTSFISASQAAKKVKFDSAYRLYSSDLKKYAATDISTALNAVTVGGKKAAIIFIHGRGHEPKKSLQGGTILEGNAVKKLETQYDLPVIMFNWKSAPSRVFPLSRSKPLKRMPVAAKALHKTLRALGEYQKALGTQPKVTLLVHSMGSIVVETMVKELGWPTDRFLFKSIIFSAADADSKNHKSWVTEIAKNENVYVVMNEDDKALKRSNNSRTKGFLPLGIDTSVDLAENVRYINITGLGIKLGEGIRTHEIFNKSEMEGQVNICNLFEHALVGDVLLNSNGQELYPKGVLTKAKFLRKVGDICFTKVKQ